MRVDCDGATGILGDDGIGGQRTDDYSTNPVDGSLKVHRCGKFSSVPTLILIYVIWVFSAFATYSDFDPWEVHAERAKNRRTARIRRTSTRSDAGGRAMDARGKRAWVAVAPPMVGRRRLCRARPLVGSCRFIRIAGDRYRDRYCGQVSRCHLPSPNGRRILTHRVRGRGLESFGKPASQRAGRSGEEEYVHRTMADACNNTMGTLTVGQASNPGPPGPLRWISTLSASVVTYALPGKLGFHGAHTAGHAADLCPPSDPFVLKLATANTTGWRPLQNFLCTTDANVIFAQEHRLLEDAIPMASAWARKHGWKSVWAPAKRGSGGGASAGTVVLARDVMGLRHPDRGGAVVADAQAVAAVIEPPLHRLRCILSSWPGA